MNNISNWALGLLATLILGGGTYIYISFLKPSQTFMQEYNNAQSRIKKMDSLLQLSNHKIDSSLSELGKIKDSISTVQKAQKTSNKTVNDAVARMQTDLKKYYSDLNTSKSSLKTKNYKIDSLERELDKLRP